MMELWRPQVRTPAPLAVYRRRPASIASTRLFVEAQFSRNVGLLYIDVTGEPKAARRIPTRTTQSPISPMVALVASNVVGEHRKPTLTVERSISNKNCDQWSNSICWRTTALRAPNLDALKKLCRLAWEHDRSGQRIGTGYLLVDETENLLFLLHPLRVEFKTLQIDINAECGGLTEVLKLNGQKQGKVSALTPHRVAVHFERHRNPCTAFKLKLFAGDGVCSSCGACSRFSRACRFLACNECSPNQHADDRVNEHGSTVDKARVRPVLERPIQNHPAKEPSDEPSCKCGQVSTVAAHLIPRSWSITSTYRKGPQHVMTTAASWQARPMPQTIETGALA